jgi:hypothetical protein
VPKKILNFRKKMNFNKISLSRLLIIIVLELALVFGLPFANANNNRALAASVVSKQDNHQIEKSDNSPYYSSDKKQVDNTESLQEKVVDKLNLNEPVPPSTKKFFKQIKGEAPIERDTPLPSEAKADSD